MSAIFRWNAAVKTLQQMNPLKIAQKDAGPYDSLLAHEVRNPLTNIDLAMEVLLAGVKDDEHKIYMDIILRSSMRINELMNELIKCQEEKKEKEG
jgi:nitrogen-specific signal transduction histidine kinase